MPNLKSLFSVARRLKEMRYLLTLVGTLFVLVFSIFVSSEVVKLRAYNKIIDNIRVSNKSGRFESSANYLGEARNLISNSLILTFTKKTELWLLGELTGIYASQVDEKEQSDYQTQVAVNTPTLVTSKSKPVPTISSTPIQVVTLTPTRVTEGFSESQTYPIIRSFSDNLGSVNKYSSYNGYFGSYNSPATGKTIKVGDTITWTTIATDPNGREIKYNLNSNSRRLNQTYGESQYKPENKFTYQFTLEDLQTAGETFRIVVQMRTDKENYRFQGLYDDAAYLDYTLVR